MWECKEERCTRILGANWFLKLVQVKMRKKYSNDDFII